MHKKPQAFEEQWKSLPVFYSRRKKEPKAFKNIELITKFKTLLQEKQFQLPPARIKNSSMKVLKTGQEKRNMIKMTKTFKLTQMVVSSSKHCFRKIKATSARQIQLRIHGNIRFVFWKRSCLYIPLLYWWSYFSKINVNKSSKSATFFWSNNVQIKVTSNIIAHFNMTKTLISE